MKALLVSALFCAVSLGYAQTPATFQVIGGKFLAHSISGDGNTLLGEANGKPATWNTVHGLVALSNPFGGDGFAEDSSSDASIIVGRAGGRGMIWKSGVAYVQAPGFCNGISNDGLKILRYDSDTKGTYWSDEAIRLARFYPNQVLPAISGDGEVATSGAQLLYPRQGTSKPAGSANVIDAVTLHGENYYGTWYLRDDYDDMMIDTHWRDVGRNIEIVNLGGSYDLYEVKTSISDDDVLAGAADQVYFIRTRERRTIASLMALNGVTVPADLHDYVVEAIASDGLTICGIATNQLSQRISWRATIGLYGKSDVYQVAPNATLKVAAPGVLANDPYLMDGKAVLVGHPQHGTINLRTDGSFSYTPESNYLGRDTFTYKISKSATVSAPITVVLKAGVPSSVTLTPPAVLGGGKVSAKVILNFIAFAPTPVAVKATKPSLVTMPSSVTVPAGSRSTSFTIGTSIPTVSTNTTIVATLDEVSVTANLSVMASSPKSLTFDPPDIRGGLRATGHATLWKPAPAGGLEVTFSSSNTSIATVPAGVTVPAGAQTFDVPVSTVVVDKATPVTITVSGNGSTASAVLSVRPPTMIDVQLGSDSVVSGGTVNVKITMDVAPVQYGYGFNVSDGRYYEIYKSQIANVPFHAPTTGQLITISVVVTGSDGKSFSRQLQVRPTSLTGMNISSSAVVGGNPATVSGAYDGVPDPNYQLSLSSSRPDVASVPASVASNKSAVVTTAAVSADTPVTITGTYNGKSQSVGTVLIPARLNGLTLNPTSVQGGYNSLATVTLDGPAGPGGSKIDLSSSDVKVATVPSSVTVPAGYKSATFTVTTKPVASSSTVKIVAAKPNNGFAAFLTVTP